MQVIEHIQGHYDVEDVEFGRVYKWHPGSVVVECVCGERLTLTSSAPTCGECGADHASILREVSAGRRPQMDKDARPWRYWRSSKDSGLPL